MQSELNFENVVYLLCILKIDGDILDIWTVLLIQNKLILAKFLNISVNFEDKQNRRPHFGNPETINV